LNEQQANEKLLELYNTVSSNIGTRPKVLRSLRAITILCPYPYRHVQIILRLYRSPSEILLGFDIDCCCVGYDGKDLWCMERFRRAITKRYNLANKSRRSYTYEQRLFKYSKRGFAVAIPDLDKNNLNVQIFQYNRYSKANGLKKLLLFDFRECQKISKGFFPKRVERRYQKLDQEGSDYSDVTVPWGPKFDQVEQIVNQVKNKDKVAFFFCYSKKEI